MLDAIKALLDSKVINEDTGSEIMEAWDSRLNEAKEELRTELREEFANKYDHDKTVMVEALDKMVTEGLQSEIQEFNEEKAALAADRVKFQRKMSEHATRFNNFMTVKLAEEIKDLRSDRIKQMEGLKLVENFVARKLATEINEFAEDKRDLVETKVKLVKEARTQLGKLKHRFVTESAAKVKAHVGSKLSTELSTLQEDIKASREESFGRRIFEAFSSEFSATHLNENAEIRKLKKLVNKKNSQLKESKVKTAKLRTLTESKDKKIRMINESNERAEVLKDLLGPLNAEKRETMQNLLENVQTKRLSNTFEKYLPAVLGQKQSKKAPRRVLKESRKEVTGDKTVKKTKRADDDIVSNVVKLAGL